MFFITLGIIVTALLLATYPSIIAIVMRKLLGFQIVEVMMKNPFYLTSIFCHIKSKRWGVEHLTISIGKIKIQFSLTNLKIIIKVQQMKLFIGRRTIGLNSVKIIDGSQEAAILQNLIEEIIQYILQQRQQTFKSPNYQPYQINHQISKLKLILNAFLFFCSVVFLQFLELRINDAEVAVILQIPTKFIDFTSKVKSSETLLLMQYLSQYKFSIAQVILTIKIKNNQEEQIDISCPQIKLQTYRHIQKCLCEVKNFHFLISIPFTFSFQESIRRLNLFIQVHHINFFTTPSDFADVSQIIQELLFDPYSQQNVTYANQQSPSMLNLTVNVNEIQLSLQSLFEPQYDSHNTFEQLSNIAVASLKFTEVSLKKGAFTIAQTVLAKLNQVNTQEQEINKIIILSIPQLLIDNSGKNIDIKHKQVYVNCEKQQLALLGKLFSIINSRIRLDKYNKALYQPYLEVAEKYKKQEINLIQAIIISLSTDKYIKPLTDQHDEIINEQKVINYIPMTIDFKLKLSKLIHRVSLSSACYIQERKIQGIVHQLLLPKIIIQYKSIRQFIVSDFKLIFQQSGLSQKLSIFINQIIMNQNYETLIEYLLSFTIFKNLLQLGGKQEGDQSVGNGKKSNKIVNIQKISVNYNTQTVTIRKLTLDKLCAANGYLSHLYFSTAKCDITLNQMTCAKVKYPIHNTHILLTLTSLSIKTILVEVDKVIKQKSHIHVKSPNLIFPETNISSRVCSYVQNFAKLQIYIEAFMQNVTDDQLKISKQKMQQLVQQPQIIILKITDITLGIEDSLYDISLLNHSRLGREYLNKERIYNQIELINQIKKNKKVCKLLDMHIESITMQVQPIEGLGTSLQGIQEWVKKISEKMIDQARLRRIEGQFLKLIISDVIVKIRDYPMNIMKLESAQMMGQLIHTLNIYNQTHHYSKFESTIGKLDINIGLNLLSGGGQIYRRIQNYVNLMKKTVSTQQWLKQFQKNNKQKKQKKDINKSQNNQNTIRPYWHTLHKNSKWHFQLNKISITTINILTETTPYSLDCFQLLIGDWTLTSRLESTTLILKFLKICTPNYQILTLQKLLVELKTQYIQPLLDVKLYVKIGDINQQDTNRILFSKDLVDYVLGIKQLRADWLKIYGLIDLDDGKKQLMMENKDTRMNYFQIVNIAANRSLQHSANQLSIVGVINKIKLKVLMGELQIQISNRKQLVRVSLDEIQVDCLIKPDKKEEVWRAQRVKARLGNIIGKVGGKNQELFLRKYKQIHSKIKQHQHIDKQELDLVKNIFLLGKQIKFTLRSLNFNQNNEIVYCTRYIQMKEVKAQISLELKQTLIKLLGDLTLQSKISLPKNSLPQTCFDKFRTLVKHVIRMNRAKKKKMRTYQTILVIKEISLGLKTQKLQLILNSCSKTTLTVNTIFLPNDKYHIDPLLDLSLYFRQLTIHIQNMSQVWFVQSGVKPIIQSRQQILSSDILQINSKSYKNKVALSQHLKDRVNITNCCYKTGVIELTSQTSASLKQIVNFMVELIDRREQRLRIKRLDSQKYAELMSLGRDKIKQKLSWNYCDTKKGEILDTKFELLLLDMNINLIDSKKDTFIKIQSSSMRFHINLYSNLKKEIFLDVRQLSIINSMEDLNSHFRSVLQMNHTQTVAIGVSAQMYQIESINPQIIWDVFPSIHIHINPIKFRITEELIAQLDKFWLLEEGQNNSNKHIEQDIDFKYSHRIPNHIHKLHIDEVKVQIWFRTQSILKRMEGISVGLQKYELSDSFITKKQLYRGWLKFVLKQLASQFFNVLGQKMFGP